MLEAGVSDKSIIHRKSKHDPFLFKLKYWGPAARWLGRVANRKGEERQADVIPYEVKRYEGQNQPKEISEARARWLEHSQQTEHVFRTMNIPFHTNELTDIQLEMVSGFSRIEGESPHVITELRELFSKDITELHNFYDTNNRRRSKNSSEQFVSVWLGTTLDTIRTAPENEKGKIIDQALYILKLKSPFLNLDPEDVTHIYSCLHELQTRAIQHKGVMENATREEITLQICQFLSLNSYDMQTVINRPLDTEWGHDRRKTYLPYPDDEEHELLSEFARYSDQDKFSAILALSSPYKCSLGKSTIGQEHTKKMINQMELGLDLVHQITDPYLQSEAEWVLTRQLYHNQGGFFRTRGMQKLSPSTKERLIEYREFRKKKPLWKDKLSFYRNIQGNVAHDVSPAFKISAGLSTGYSAALAILQTGSYFSLHEIFTGNGCTNVSTRARGEHCLGLLSTGTPDDPYVVYGAARVNEERLFRKVHYGGCTLLLKPEVWERCSATDDDSLDHHKNIPVAGYNQIRGLEFKRVENKLEFSTWDEERHYTEIQVHGGVTTNDIRAIVFEKEPPEEIRTVITVRANKLGIPIINLYNNAS